MSQRGPYAPHLARAITCAQKDLGRIETLAAQIGRDVADISGVHRDAPPWTQQLSAEV